MTALASRQCAVSDSASVTSAWRTSTLPYHGWPRALASSRTRTRIGYPLASRHSANLLPMKPVAPVRTTRAWPGSDELPAIGIEEFECGGGEHADVIQALFRAVAAEMLNLHRGQVGKAAVFAQFHREREVLEIEEEAFIEAAHAFQHRRLAQHEAAAEQRHTEGGLPLLHDFSQFIAQQ